MLVPQIKTLRRVSNARVSVMSRACLGLRRAWWVGWWATLAIVSLHTARDALAPSACETTYLWQAYEEILLPSNVGQQRGYRLIRYVDNPTEEAQGGGVFNSEPRRWCAGGSHGLTLSKTLLIC